MPPDLQLLSRYHRQGDPAAFAELVQTHGGMVFATACRITRDAALAEDVAQEVFLTLARQSCEKIECLAAWLHRVAWVKARNVVVTESRRRVREAAAAEMLHSTEEPSWHELEPLVDEVIAELPEKLRNLLIEHYLERRTQAEIAHDHGIHQATVSRQIESGLQLLRDGLRHKGVLCGCALAGILSTNTAQAVPATLIASLGKLAMTGIGTAAPASATFFTTTLLIMTSTAKIFLATAAISIPFGWWLAQPRASAPPAKSSAIPTQVKRPALPAPKLAPMSAEQPAATKPPGTAEGPLARFFKDNGKALKLSAAQITAYLAQNRRSAESLLAAMRLTGDIAFLREAAQKFPNDPAVQTEMALRSGDAAERRRAIDAMRAADPDNALGDHLSALDHLRHSRMEEAYNDLITAAGKTRFDDHALQAQQSAEEAYMTAGFSAVEAKAAAMLGLQRRQIEPMRDLSKQLAKLHQGYSSSGDAASAESLRQMGEALGRQMQGSASYLIDELVGISIERQFTPAADGGARQRELQQRADAIRALGGSPHWQALMESSNTAEITLYLDRLKLYGEAATIQWLNQR